MSCDTVVVIETTLPPTVIVTPGGPSSVITATPVAPTIVETSSPPASVDVNQFFQTLLKFSELDDETKRTTARSNLGLQNIDGGTFF